jgi:hypothetical protein
MSHVCESCMHRGLQLARGLTYGAVGAPVPHFDGAVTRAGEEHVWIGGEEGEARHQVLRTASHGSEGQQDESRRGEGWGPP